MGRRMSRAQTGRLVRQASRVARDIDRAANGKKRPDARARTRRAWLTAGVFAALVILVALDRSGSLVTPTPDVARYDGATTRAVRVIDGDTLVVGLIDPRTNEPTRVRLLGIDAPEAAREGVPAEPFADEATAFLRAFVERGEVTLLVEPARARDRYGRLLAHVVVNGESAAAALVGAGLAESVAQWRNRDTDRLEALELGARRAKRGIWATDADSAGDRRDARP